MNEQPMPADEVTPIYPDVVDVSSADPTRDFRVIGNTSYLYFVPRGKNLLVSFDNLATLDDGYPRKPWLDRVADELGWSILGVQSQAKDWFRQTDATALVIRLVRDGFFKKFDNIVMVGASMGGFAAINFAPLVPGARVLAFSPQSTMSREIAPFEARYAWAVNNSNWTAMPFLDAAAALPYVPQVTIVYDPFVPEDEKHVRRLAGAHVQYLRVDHSSHEAVRCIMKCGAIGPMLRDMAAMGYVGDGIWKLLRARRNQRKWCRALLSVAEPRHPRLALRAAQALVQRDNYLFAMQVVNRLSPGTERADDKHDARTE